MLSARAGGLAVVVLSFAAVAVVAVRESVNGLETVAGTATGVSLILLLLTFIAIAIALTSRRSDTRWPRLAIAGLATISLVLVATVVMATVRGHTASERFSDEAARFPLPSSYKNMLAADANVQHSGKPELTLKAWQVPAGADACGDIEEAFAAWTDAEAETFSRGEGCSVAAKDSSDKIEVSVSADGTTVLLEMWLEGTSLIHF